MVWGPWCRGVLVCNWVQHIDTSCVWFPLARRESWGQWSGNVRHGGGGGGEALSFLSHMCCLKDSGFTCGSIFN